MRITVRRMMAVVLALALPMSLLHAVRNAREDANASACHGKLHHYGFGVRNYHDLTGSLPPAFSMDRTGRRMHSWRGEMLRITETTIRGSYDYLVAWDAPANAAHRSSDRSGHLNWCPSGGGETTKETDYVAVVGPHTAWPGETGRRLDEITDDPAETILLVEVAGSGIHWMEPKDPTLEEYLAFGPSSRHSGFFFALFADFRVKKVRKNVDRATLKALLTIDGGETVDPKSWGFGAPAGR